ncbi:MAG: 4Fe-4S binding protein, partial [Anaerolineales bacterium]|nr:4Fe-4S binding protein [Anaerolineales bacterium]
KPVAVAAVAQLAARFEVPVVGTGGVIRAEDAVEMLMAGASAVGACTAPVLRGMGWFGKTNEALSRWLDDHGHASVSAVRGYALPHLPLQDDSEGLSFQFEPTKCTLCNQCVVVCSYDARKVIGEVSRSADIEMIFNEERCRSCGLCVEVCKPAALVADWPRRKP